MIVKYRTFYKIQPPRQIKLEIPGWSGENEKRESGNKPQPWHCPPFVEGSTYGHELLYPYKSECFVKRINGQIIFEGDFSEEQWMLSSGEDKKIIPPMMNFSPDHYGMSSNLDLEPPEGYVIRTEPHPKFYTDNTGTVPCMLAGHIQRWWSRIFFVVFKAPREGETQIFRPGEPYGQLLFVPQKNNIEFKPFSEKERQTREIRERKISDHGRKISSHSWLDNRMLTFDDKYKVLSSAYSKGSYEKVDKIIDEKISGTSKIKTKIPKRLFLNK